MFAPLELVVSFADDTTRTMKKDNAMSIAEDYKQKKEDYHTLKELCGGADVSDYCGAWCNNDMMTSMLENPTKKNAMQMYSSLISAYLQNGCEASSGANEGGTIDVHHPEVYEILKRNGDLG